jgi:uncharacterized protein DUF6644
MTTLQELCQWLYDMPVNTALRESDEVFPLIETAHVLAIVLITGAIVTVDLRILGVILRQVPLARITRTLLPYTWYGFGLMAVTGLPLFAAEAAKLYGNPAFRVKLLLLGLAGVNALLFHRTAGRGIEQWDPQRTPSPQARAFAGVSVMLWAGVIVSGRLIAVFHGH